MKKFLAILMAVMCVCTLGVAAEDPDTKGANVLYDVNQKYTWSIHSDIDFGDDAGINRTVERLVDIEDADAKVAVSENVIAHGKRLSITIASANGFQVKTAANDALNYEVRLGNASGAALVNNAEVLGVNAGTNAGEQALYFKLTTTTATAEVAGNYSDALTYTASIIDQQ